MSHFAATSHIKPAKIAVARMAAHKPGRPEEFATLAMGMATPKNSPRTDPVKTAGNPIMPWATLKTKC
jgi:hypothetical protein